MKIHRLFLPAFVGILLAPITITGAECENAHNGATLLTEGRRDALIAQIDSAKESVGIATPFFSDPRVQAALVAAHKRGVPVAVYVARRAKADRLAHAGMQVEVVKGLHAKLAVIDGTVVIGSDNWSQVSAARETEMAVLVHTPRTAAQARKHFDSIPVLSGVGAGATPTRPTPKKPTMMRGHNGYKANRMQKFVTHPSSGNRLDVFSMGLESERIVQEVERTFASCPIDAQPRMRFFLDKSALSHTNLLSRLKAAGGNNVSIRIFNADGSQKIWGRFTDIAHQKAIARRVVGTDGTLSTHVIISTGNLARQSDREINFDYHRPGDEQVYDQLRALGDRYAADDAWTSYDGAGAPVVRRSVRLAGQRALQKRAPEMPVAAPQPRRASRRPIFDADVNPGRRSPRLAALREAASEH